MSVTRRSFLELVAAVGGTVCTGLVPRESFLPAPPSEVIEAEIIDDVAVAPPTGKRTKLETFLKTRGIKPADLAVESGYSRQHLLRVRLGKMEPTRRCIVAIVAACRRMAREDVQASDLFDMGDFA